MADATSEAGVNAGDGSVSITFTPETPAQCEELGGRIVFVEVATVAVAVTAAARFTG